MRIIIYSALHSGKNIKQTNHLHETLPPQPYSSSSSLAYGTYGLTPPPLEWYPIQTFCFPLHLLTLINFRFWSSCFILLPGFPRNTFFTVLSSHIITKWPAHHTNPFELAFCGLHDFSMFLTSVTYITVMLCITVIWLPLQKFPVHFYTALIWRLNSHCLENYQALDALPAAVLSHCVIQRLGHKMQFLAQFHHTNLCLYTCSNV